MNCRILIAVLCMVLQGCSDLQGPNGSPGAASAAIMPFSSVTSTKLILVSDDFWTLPDVSKSLGDMPARLRRRTSDPTARAEQLQWALKAANESTVQNVEIWIQPGDYDFSSLGDAHLSTSRTDGSIAYLPKLYVARDDLRLLSNSGRPRLFYRGVGRDGVNHGRVLLLVESGRKGVLVEGLQFEGDHSSSEITNASYYAHENNSGLRALGYTGSTEYGIVMIGYAGGANDVEIRHCSFIAFSFQGIHIVGNARIRNNVITGIIPESWGPGFTDTVYYSAYDAVAARMGFVGMKFGSGIGQRGAYGPLEISGNEIRNVVEGFVSAGTPPASRLVDNRFSTVADHGIYILGATMEGSRIAENRFDKVLGSALKLAGATDEGSDPRDTKANLRRITIAANEFSNVPGGSMELTGTFNTIRDNLVHNYSRATDPGGHYDSTGPDITLNHRGGGPAFWNHVSFNLVENNRVVGDQRLVEIHLNHYPDESHDRSLGLNHFSGGGQRVSLSAHLGSWYAPMNVMSGSQLTLTPPAGSSRGSSTYRRSVEVQWHMSLRAGAGKLLLFKYVEGDDIFVITPTGRHERVNPAGRAFDVLGAADLDGDGYDEVYSRERGVLYGSKLFTAYRDGLHPLDQWIFGDPGSELLGWSFSDRFYAVFAHAPNRVYMSGPRADGWVHVVGQVYAFEGGINSLPATTASWGLTSADFQNELLRVFNAVFAGN